MLKYKVLMLWAGLNVLVFGAEIDYPKWWITRGIISAENEPNDYAVANLGQLKHMALECAKELEMLLPGGAGNDVWEVVGSFGQKDNNAIFNIGQLKRVATPFYDRLSGQYADALPGAPGVYPWSGREFGVNDYAAVNIGQLKAVFNIKLNRIQAESAEAGLSVRGKILYADYSRWGFDPMAERSDLIVSVSPTKLGHGSLFSTTLTYRFQSFLFPRYVSWSLPMDIPPNWDSYYFKAYLDLDGNGVGNDMEPWAVYHHDATRLGLPFPLEIQLDLRTGGNSDADDLDDWWELNHLGSIDEVAGGDDPDNDLLSISDELALGTDPLHDDSDGDGILDKVDSAPLERDVNRNGLRDGLDNLIQGKVADGPGGLLIQLPSGFYYGVEPDFSLEFVGR